MLDDRRVFRRSMTTRLVDSRTLDIWYSTYLLHRVSFLKSQQVPTRNPARRTNTVGHVIVTGGLTHVAHGSYCGFYLDSDFHGQWSKRERLL
jgi:hypothetical protein